MAEWSKHYKSTNIWKIGFIHSFLVLHNYLEPLGEDQTVPLVRRSKQVFTVLEKDQFDFENRKTCFPHSFLSLSKKAFEGAPLPPSELQSSILFTPKCRHICSTLANTSSYKVIVQRKHQQPQCDNTDFKTSQTLTQSYVCVANHIPTDSTCCKSFIHVHFKQQP